MKRLWMLPLGIALLAAGCGQKPEEPKPGTTLPQMDKLMQDQMKRGTGGGQGAPGQPMPGGGR